MTSNGPCLDPALAPDLRPRSGLPDLRLPDTGLCDHGGSVMHSNETFDLSWDPVRRDWATTRDYVEQFLRDVADGSGTLTSPFAVTPQYTDATGRAGNASLYGGGCIDYGAVGGSTCKFGDVDGDRPRARLLPGPEGTAVRSTGLEPVPRSPERRVGTPPPMTSALNDAQVQGEVATMIKQEFKNESMVRRNAAGLYAAGRRDDAAGRRVVSRRHRHAVLGQRRHAADSECRTV